MDAAVDGWETYGLKLGDWQGGIDADIGKIHELKAAYLDACQRSEAEIDAEFIGSIDAIVTELRGGAMKIGVLAEDWEHGVLQDSTEITEWIGTKRAYRDNS